MDEFWMYIAIDVISFLGMAHLVWYVIDELTDILNIHCFIITKALNEKAK